MIAATAVVLNLLSVGAAYGILVAVFQHGWLARRLRLPDERRDRQLAAAVPLRRPLRPLDGLPRLHPQPDQGAPRRGCVDRRRRSGSAITRTAGTVTSAAIIMVAVFGLFASLSMIMMQQMGFGLAIAVLIDATVDPRGARARDDEAARRVELVPAARARVAAEGERGEGPARPGAARPRRCPEPRPAACGEPASRDRCRPGCAHDRRRSS